MGVPVSNKSKAPTKKSGPPCNGPAMGGGSGVPFGGKTFVGGGGGKRGSEALSAASETAPDWGTGIPDKTTASADLSDSYIVAPYLVKDPYPVTFKLVTPPAGFAITEAGKVVAAVGTAVAGHSITVSATNPFGTTNDTFTWTITA